MKHKNVLLTLISLGAIMITNMACSSAQPSGAEKLAVAVSILPQQYFVEQIGGELVEVNVMVGPGEEPHTFEPQPSQMENLSKSQLYFTIGVEFEDAWLNKFEEINPSIQFIDCSSGIEKISTSESIPLVNGETQGEEHEHGSLDPHIWLSPANVKIIAQTIANALSVADPQNSTIYEKNLELFLQDINDLDEEIRISLATLATRQFIVFHPAWGYFAHDYDLEQIAIEIGGNEPSASELANLIDYAQANDIHVIFASPEFSTKSAETIAEEIDGQVILISPLAENWLENMKTIAQALEDSLQ